MAQPEHLKILKQGVEAWNRWREENPQVQPDLKNADCRGELLWGAHLEKTDLRGADLKRALLRGAYLQDANLQQARLQGAQLVGALFVGRSSWMGTDFSNASFGATGIIAIDLSQAIGLETTRHSSPSFIDTKSLDRTAHGLNATNTRRTAIEFFTGWEHNNAKFEGQLERVVRALRARLASL